jgi:hypothetical protein
MWRNEMKLAAKYQSWRRVKLAQSGVSSAKMAQAAI